MKKLTSRLVAGAILLAGVAIGSSAEAWANYWTATTWHADLLQVYQHDIVHVTALRGDIVQYILADGTVYRCRVDPNWLVTAGGTCFKHE